MPAGVVCTIREAVAAWTTDAAAAREKYGDIQAWDVSRVTSLEGLFASATDFKEDISWWDTSGVTNMDRLFAKCACFDGDLSNWQTESVHSARQAFYGAKAFTGVGLEAWDTSQVTSMRGMFSRAYAFDGNVSTWDVEAVTDFAFMFDEASKFTGTGLEKWDTRSATTMEAMFSSASAFDGDVSEWRTSRVIVLAAMFHGASSFNRDLSEWDVSQVWDITDMCKDAAIYDSNSKWCFSPIVQGFDGAFAGTACAENGCGNKQSFDCPLPGSDAPPLTRNSPPPTPGTLPPGMPRGPAPSLTRGDNPTPRPTWSPPAADDITTPRPSRAPTLSPTHAPTLSLTLPPPGVEHAVADVDAKVVFQTRTSLSEFLSEVAAVQALKRTLAGLTDVDEVRVRIRGGRIKRRRLMAPISSTSLEVEYTLGLDIAGSAGAGVAAAAALATADVTDRLLAAILSGAFAAALAESLAYENATLDMGTVDTDASVAAVSAAIVTLTVAPPESTALTSAPTATACADSQTWFKAGKPSKGCAWVAKDTAWRCRRVGEDGNTALASCAVTCDACGLDDCGDSATWHKRGNPTKDCAWVADDTDKRCSKFDEDKVPALTECAATCDSCGSCTNEWSKKGKTSKGCAWVLKKPAKRCSLQGSDGALASVACCDC
ncbi:hypothetical protein M885DRAFT_575454 [Pelagophyceae sp. CCMP2097]|nr:hypothetical protein M885DRAFT_575454 [Pelagophyceae sp. CCMP2097]